MKEQETIRMDKVGMSKYYLCWEKGAKVVIIIEIYLLKLADKAGYKVAVGSGYFHYYLFKEMCLVWLFVLNQFF
jgi:hypothetical protein